MIDKLSILSGESKVKFGGGEMIVPIKILVNARFNGRYDNEKIEYMKIVSDTIKKHFPLLDVENI